MVWQRVGLQQVHLEEVSLAGVLGLAAAMDEASASRRPPKPTEKLDCSSFIPDPIDDMY